jgi:hypothetical protein
MSKDARMKPEVLQAGYPRLGEFKAVLKKYNPDGKIRSTQSDRLLLTPVASAKPQVTGIKVQTAKEAVTL